LLLRLGQDWEAPLIRRAVPVLAAFYMVCAILRLARFNIENSPDPAAHKRFKGLPSPAAAGCLASLAMLRGVTPDTLIGLEPVLHSSIKLWAPVGALVIALLMVSRVPYPHLTKQLLRGHRHFSYLVRIVLAAFIILLLRELALVVIFWGYALTFVIRYLVIRGLKSQRLPLPSTGIDDRLPR
jgi:CDP-diacylglycerol--serine O-phosphatidyltransferase